MTRLRQIADRLHLVADLWLHRHGPWWLVVAGGLAVLLGFALIVMPRLDAELATKVATLNALQARLATDQTPPTVAAPVAAGSAFHYQVFSETLADDERVLPSVKIILDSAADHRLISTRAEYVYAVDANAQAATLQMTVPVKGRYSDIRRWIEKILRAHAYVAVNELAFKREEVGLNQVEAKVRLTVWHRPASPGERRRRMDAVVVDP